MRGILGRRKNESKGSEALSNDGEDAAVSRLQRTGEKYDIRSDRWGEVGRP